MIHVLMLINFMTNGGPSRVVENIAYGLNKKHFKVTVFTFIDENHPDVIKRLEDQGINVVSLNFSKSLKEIIKNRKLIIKKIQALSPDIIHAHSIVPAFLALSCHFPVKRIATIHNIMNEDYRYTYGTLKGALLVKTHLLFLKKFDAVIGCSESANAFLKKHIKKSICIRNGVAISKPSKNSRATIRKALKINQTDILYVYGGVFNQRKRVEQLAKLFHFNHQSDEYLLLVGKGDQKSAIENLHDSHILLLDFRDNIMDYYSAADAYISNSSSEGMPIAVIEALGLGLPCLLSNIGPHNELFAIDRNTYIGETFNEKNFAEKKSQLRHRLSNIDRTAIISFQRNNYSCNNMAAQYSDIYYNIMREG